MRRLSLVLVAAVMAVWLFGCGESQEKQFSNKVESHLNKLDQRIDTAFQAKNNLDSNLTSMNASIAKLQQDATSLRSSIEELNTSLRNLQEEMKILRSDQTQFKRQLEGGGLWRWLLIIIIFGAVVYLGYHFFFKRKPFEEEDEDFTAFEEDLGYEDKMDTELVEEKEEETRPSI